MLLIVEGTAEHAPEVLRCATEDVVELVTRYCGGAVESAVKWPRTTSGSGTPPG